mmetsp:Transcript_18919/g.30747  ORF Transcript_18919/g.30747 Transcript_18919/m.30747 type:complete len:483 (-) Transcript_18919:297-1745(-)
MGIFLHLASSVRLFILLLLVPLNTNGVIRVPVTRREAPPSREKTKLRFGTLLSKGHNAELLDLHILPLENLNNLEYLAVVGIGTPPQNLSVVMDTGSSDLWITGVGCSPCSGTARFQITSSVTESTACSGCGPPSRELDDYGSGPVYGYTFQDVFTLGSSTTTSTIKMGYVTSMGSSQQQLLDEGIFGLAFPALAQYSTPSPIKTWLDEAGLPNSYAFYMTTNAPGSQITFGGFAEELLGNTTVEYTDVIQTNLQSGTAFAYWTVAMSQFTLGATISGSGLTTIVDSGTSLIALPPNALIAVFQALIDLPAASACEATTSYFVCPRSTNLDAFPVLKVRFPSSFSPGNDTVLTLSGSEYFLPPNQGIYQMGLSSSGDSQFAILGDVLLRKYYTLFDWDNHRVGFAGAIVENSLPGGGDDNGGNNNDQVTYIAVGVVLGVIFVGILGAFVVRRMIASSNRSNAYGTVGRQDQGGYYRQQDAEG